MHKAEPTELIEAKNCDIKFPKKFNTNGLFKDDKPYSLNKSASATDLQSNEAIRNSVIKELLETEINYVKLLSSICVGYEELAKNSFPNFFNIKFIFHLDF